MISGWIENQIALLRLTLVGTHGDIKEVDAIIDTGYTGFLSMSQRIVDELDLLWYSSGHGQLADGSECKFEIYTIDVLWDGALRNCLVYAVDSQPLVGLNLLSGYELNIQWIENGKVTITKM